jgi:fructokinase
MPKLITIGEVLIDFIPKQKDMKLDQVETFRKVAGGAPANVASCVSKLGQKSTIFTQVGNDGFGRFLIGTLNNVGVDTSNITVTNQANTGLAFVSIDAFGERDFSFYRNPSADLLFEESQLKEEVFQTGDILHFCSVNLVESPMKQAHKQAIDIALDNDMIISFDPNLRFPLWDDLEEYYQTLQEFLPYAHILKISSDELEFITRINNKEEAIKSLFKGNVEVVIFTEGSKQASIITQYNSVTVPSYNVNTVDTTGAGDAFIGGILYHILKENIGVDSLHLLVNETVLNVVHAVSAIVVSKFGAIPALPTIKEVNDFLKGVKE